MNKFTKGPWLYEVVGNSTADWCGDDVCEIISADRQVRIAEYVGAADARLIAAAPEMYATLEMVLAILCDKEICGHFLPREIREEIEPVLAKIKGE